MKKKLALRALILTGVIAASVVYVPQSNIVYAASAENTHTIETLISKFSNWQKDRKTLSVEQIKNIALKNNREANYVCTPAATGKYTITVDKNIENNEKVECILFDSKGHALAPTIEENSGTKTYEYDLDAGENYSVSLKTDAQKITSVSVSLDKISAPKIKENISVNINETKFIELENKNDITSIVWKCSDETIAIVSENGEITGLTEGKVVVTATGTDAEGQSFETNAEILVTPPVLSSNKVYLNVYGVEENEDGFFVCENNEIKISGLVKNSEITCETSSENLKILGEYNNTENATYTVLATECGDYNIKFMVNGVELNCSVSVINAGFERNEYTMYGDKGSWDKESVLTLAPEETTELTTFGFPETGTINWASSDESVVTVENGKVTAVGYGTAVITADYNGAIIAYNVNVIPRASVCVIRYCEEHYNSTYSQEKRMEKDFYDCSSYVWRGYEDAGFYMQSKTYAPTAAAAAKWCAQNGYMIYTTKVDTEKLLPGDLIFWCNADNGRYKGIYHVDLYIGNNQSITVKRTNDCGETLPSKAIVARPFGTEVLSTTFSESDIDLTNIDNKLFDLEKTTPELTYTMSWNALYGATGYEIYESDKKDGNYEKIADVAKCEFTRAKEGCFYKVKAYWTNEGATNYGVLSEAFAVPETTESNVIFESNKTDM